MNITKDPVMKIRQFTAPVLAAGLVIAGFAWIYAGCMKSALPIAPYVPGAVMLDSLLVEGGVYAPRVSWIGGYVAAIGVNSGRRAILDTSLIWLEEGSGGPIHYQARFGTVPSGATDLTTAYGGHPATRLQEDHVYTFWIAKADVWSAMTANAGKTLVADSSATVAARSSNDTLYLSAQSFLSRVDTIDVYIGIRNVFAVGRLGTISVFQTDTSNSPVITFHIAQAGQAPPDTLLTNMGICEGQQYDVGSVIWEVLAVDSSSGTPQYWTTDVITSPVIAGQIIPKTAIFTQYPEGGLQRKKTYYVWIDNKAWDQRSRLRSTYNYASATFDTY